MDVVALFEQISALEAELSRDLQPLRRIIEAVAAGGFGFRKVRASRYVDYLGGSWEPSASTDVLLRFSVDEDFACVVRFESGGAFVVEVEDSSADREIDSGIDGNDPTMTFHEERACIAVLSQLEEYASRIAER